MWQNNEANVTFNFEFCYQQLKNSPLGILAENWKKQTLDLHCMLSETGISKFSIDFWRSTGEAE